jgi:hypothetical protein
MADAPNPAPDPVQQVFQVATGYVPSTALYLAVQAGIADHLADGPRTTNELAKATGSNEDALYRVLRLLASLGIFEETAPKQFALTPAADVLRTDAPRSIRDVVLFVADPLHFRVYADAIHSLRSGAPSAEQTLGMPVFQYFETHPDYSAIFNNAMTTLSASMVPAVLEAYDFSGIDVLVDIAGGHGRLLAAILKKYPRMKGVLFDRDHVIAGAGAPIAKAGVADRCQTASGDFFQSVPRGGDAYIMKHIIHDWDDERATRILRSIHAAMESRGTLLLVEGVVTPGNEPGLGKVMDLEMLLLPGGRERSADDFSALFERAGFALTRIVPTKSPVSVIEARKR